MELFADWAIEQAFTQLSGKDARVRKVESVTDALDEAGGLEATDVIVDLVFVRADRGISLGLFIDVLSPFDSDLREHLTATRVRRLSGQPVAAYRPAERLGEISGGRFDQLGPRQTSACVRPHMCGHRRRPALGGVQSGVQSERN